jgi:hypothetical protein
MAEIIIDFEKRRLLAEYEAIQNRVLGSRGELLPSEYRRMARREAYIARRLAPLGLYPNGQLIGGRP